MDLWRVTSPVWHGLMNALQGATIDTLRLIQVNLCPLTATEVERLTTLRVRSNFYIASCHLLSNHITDAFLLKLSTMGLPSTTVIKGCTPVDKAAFAASDDGALALCFPTGQSPQAGGEPFVVLLPELSLSENFYLKCVQVNAYFTCL